jgi:predicted RNA binding protein YcfA (HicA-like mRNA interferase family)
MPRLPVLSGQEVVQALKRLGFEEVRQRGSHVVLRRGAAGCVVPLHREIKRGTLATIIKQADISIDGLINAVR